MKFIVKKVKIYSDNRIFKITLCNNSEEEQKEKILITSVSP